MLSYLWPIILPIICWPFLFSIAESVRSVYCESQYFNNNQTKNNKSEGEIPNLLENGIFKKLSAIVSSCFLINLDLEIFVVKSYKWINSIFHYFNTQRHPAIGDNPRCVMCPSEFNKRSMLTNHSVFLSNKTTTHRQWCRKIILHSRSIAFVGHTFRNAVARTSETYSNDDFLSVHRIAECWTQGSWAGVVGTKWFPKCEAFK